MPSLVSDSEKKILTGLFSDTFDTFSRNIVIWKEPIKQQLITTPNNPGLFGFGDAQVESEYVYIPVSGIYPAVIRYVNTHRNISAAEVMDSTNTFLPIGELTIKVRPDCYAFIENGKTERFSFDNRDFFFAGKARAVPFLGSSFYMYQLKPKI